MFQVRAIEADIPSMSFAAFNPFARLRRPAMAEDSSYLQVCPPAGHDRAGAAETLQAVRLEFDGALADIASDESLRLRRRIACARSMHELWYLRAPLYGLVAVARDQAQAEHRLTRLNRHFPTRSPKSGFAPLI